MKHLIVTLLLASAISPAAAQKKPTPPPAADPEIAYVDAKPRYPEVKLANADLTGSFTVFRSVAQYSMPRYDLSPRGQNQVAVTSGGSAHIVSWSHNGSTVSVTTDPLPASASNASEISFSSDGTKIAVYYLGDSSIRIFDASTRAELQSWPAPSVYEMTWLQSGDTIAFIDPTAWRKLKQISLVDGSVSEHSFPAGDLRYLDAARSSDAILATYVENGAVPTSLYFGRWENGVLDPARIRQGFEANYNCDETRIVYKTTGPRSETLVYNVVSNTASLLTKNEDVRRVDEMPTCT